MDYQINTEGKPRISALSREARKALVDDLLEEILEYHKQEGKDK